MAIVCWDRLDGFVLSKTGNLVNRKKKKYWYLKECEYCHDEFLGSSKQSRFCSNKCSNTGINNGMYGKSSLGFTGGKHTKEAKERIRQANLGKNNHFYKKKHTKETLKKISGKNHPMYGRHHTKESKRKISEKLKGQMSGKNNPMYGYKYSDEQRKAISLKTSGINNPMYGKNHTEEAKRKMTIAQTGPNSSNWKGGISCDPYCDAWADKEYKRDIRDRDNNQCQNPGCRKNCYHLSLEIHHIDYNKMNCKPDNLITLCKSCNIRANTNRGYWTKFYQNIMRNKK